MLLRLPGRAGLGRANLQPCPLDSWLLSSATFLCWPYKQLRKLASQHPRGQGPKSILGPGYHLTREEVTACPQGGTSNNQVWGSSPHTTPPSSFAPSGLENPGPPRYCPHTHPTFPHRPPWEIFPRPRDNGSVALSLPGAWPPPTHTPAWTVRPRCG